MYEIIGTRGSRAFRVLWMLEELGVPYTHTPVGPRSDEARAVNPSGKIPALREGETVITDSVAIMTYLGDKHAQLTAPTGTLARAGQDAMTLQILDDIDAVLWTAMRHRFILPEEQRVPEIESSLQWEYTRNLARIEAAMQGPFLMGEDLRIPDILLMHCLRWAEMVAFPAPGAQISEYAARLQARDAFQTTVQLP